MPNELPMPATAIVFVLLWLLAVVLLLRALPLLYGFRIRNNTVEIVLFRRHPIWSFSFDQIIEVKVVRWFVWCDVIIANRFTTQYVVVRQRNWPKGIAITPADPDAFVREFMAAKTADSSN